MEDVCRNIAQQINHTVVFNMQGILLNMINYGYHSDLTFMFGSNNLFTPNTKIKKSRYMFPEITQNIPRIKLTVP